MLTHINASVARHWDLCNPIMPNRIEGTFAKQLNETEVQDRMFRSCFFCFFTDSLFLKSLHQPGRRVGVNFFRVPVLWTENGRSASRFAQFFSSLPLLKPAHVTQTVVVYLSEACPLLISHLIMTIRQRREPQMGPFPCPIPRRGCFLILVRILPNTLSI